MPSCLDLFIDLPCPLHLSLYFHPLILPLCSSCPCLQSSSASRAQAQALAGAPQAGASSVSDQSLVIMAVTSDGRIWQWDSPLPKFSDRLVCSAHAAATSAHTHTHSHSHSHSHSHTQSHTRTHTYMHTDTHADAHAHTHIYTLPLTLPQVLHLLHE